ncbi:hypothetical protein EDD21DRAFT_383932 [Dissophora ornata]|nr:hypothetical protein BGZ58_009075 [Dissophora ornata]KAI8597978.1 hypothetical protein EDD21DRAFT_383932 [Dissophora ornata]
MRSSLFLALASTLIASVIAHEGHEAVASVCLTTPTDASCSNYTIPAANITSAISDICTVSSFLPGCSLNTACNADSTLNATYCAPLTILASLCTPADDAALTVPVCSKTYSVFCSTSSLIPACKTQSAFPGLPSGKVVTGTVYSICQDMPMMTDCTICPGPDATTGYSKCDEVKAWKGLCLDMPDMTQCPAFNAMCTNTTFAPFCSRTYNAPSSSAATPTVSSTTPNPTARSSSANAVIGSLFMTSLFAVAAGVTAFVL